MSMRRWTTVVLLVVAWPVATPCLGAAGMGTWNVETMVKQAAEQIIRRYKLDDDQAQFTRKLMSERVDKLLEKHDDRIRQLFREAIAMRALSKPPSKQAIQSWAERALPVYQDARKQILEGNEEWAKILTPEQRKIHKLDLKMMKMDFKQYEDKLARWKQGGFDPQRDWVVRRAKPVKPSANARKQLAQKLKEKREAAEAARQRQKQKQLAQMPPNRMGGPPRLGETSPQNPTTGPAGAQPIIEDPEHFWDTYVRGFIKQYRLDEGQANQARAMLADMKKRARRYRDSRKADYDRLRAALRENRSPDMAQALQELDAPVDEMFEKLKARLENIPTSKQRARAGR